MTLFPELLAPAGNMDRFRTAILYGADAVYLGGRGGNLRAACDGFTPAELRVAVSEAIAQEASIYFCLNSLPMEKDLVSLPEQIEDAADAGVHGFIIADPGVLRLARRHAPHIPVHLSTQANTTNSEAIRFWQEQGVSRVNLARELTARDIYAIRKQLPDMELEVFVHGAMCLAVSGQCLLSSWLNGRSGNQGRCTQPCRFEYRPLAVETDALIVDEYTRPGEAVWRVEQEEHYSSFWATQDLCLLPWLGWFAKNAVTALKIEGRMKSAGYLAHTVDAYRTSLDLVKRGAFSSKARDACLEEALYAATRPLGSGFFLPGRRRNLTEELIERRGLPFIPNRSGEGRLPKLGKKLLARVLGPAGTGQWEVEVHGNWRRDMDVELMLPGLERPVLVGGSYGLENQRGELAKSVGNGTRCVLYADNYAIKPGIFIRSAL